jgi:hypothetical protein
MHDIRMIFLENAEKVCKISYHNLLISEADFVLVTNVIKDKIRRIILITSQYK